MTTVTSLKKFSSYYCFVFLLLFFGVFLLMFFVLFCFFVCLFFCFLFCCCCCCCFSIFKATNWTRWSSKTNLLRNIYTIGNLMQNLTLKFLKRTPNYKSARRQHYENKPIQIYWKFYHQKMKIFRKKIGFFFSYFCSKHRLWVLVRTASARRFWRVPTFYVLSRNKKNNVYPCKPQFYYIKVGFKGVKII